MEPISKQRGKRFEPADANVAAFTRSCQQNAGPGADARAQEVLSSLMAHLHSFVHEVQLTTEEWLYACKALARAGDITDEKRNEFILISDVLGIESLVDTLAQDRGASAVQAGPTESPAATHKPTASAILGPFYRNDVPLLPMGTDIVRDHSIQDAEGKTGEKAFVHGVVSDLNGKPIENAILDVWEDGPNGMYEQQDPNQPEFNCRGRFRTSTNGQFSFQCIKPVAYPIPHDSTAGDILHALDRSSMRPGHIHFSVQAPGYRPLITQVFDRTCPHIHSDAVFATKDDLTVDFVRVPQSDAKGVMWDLTFDIHLVREL